MKKRLISLLVALCMAVTLLPVSAITAWAEESGSTLKPLQIWSGYPVLDGITPTTDPDGHNIYTGDGWSYDGTTKTLKLNPTSPTEYDFSSLSSGGNTLDCALEIGAKATITSGSFTNDITNHGIVSGGTFSPIKSVKPCLTFANYGIITDGTFYAPLNTPSTSFELSNYSSGTIEGGNFRNSSSNFSFRNQGSINGGVFGTAPDSTLKSGYILNCAGDFNFVFYATCYVIPNTNSAYPTKITASFGFGALSPIDVTIDNTQQMLLTEWAGNIENFNDAGEFHVTFTAPPAKADTVTLSKLTRLVIDKAGYPVGTEGGTQNYSGNGWKFENGTLTLESGNYNFLYTDPVNKKGENLRSVNCGIVNEGSIIEDGIFNTLVANGQPGSTSSNPHEIEGGTFAAGLLYNDGVITGGAFNGKDSILPIGIGLSGNYRSVTVKDGAILRVNDTRPLVPGKTGYDLVQGTAWDLYSYAGTVLTVKSNVDITNINGQKIGNAFSSSYPNGETDKKVVCFEMPDSDVELNSTKIVDPDPKPEPKPEPEPEAPTYTLTVKGGTFTYNGSEAMTSASVPVDAEVKVTLNQSAVPEGMVFDLWAMDEASLLGNPAVAYNQESFTIPAGTVAKGSIVTVEAQYRDATIESEPSILGTAAIIGVAGAGTAVIVWQGYRIGMELYEKYFQPTPEEDAVVEPTLESQMTDPIS